MNLRIERAKPDDAESQTSAMFVAKDGDTLIGTRLMEQLIMFSKAAGAEIISLEVRSDNTRAIKLYEKFGFEKISVFKEFFKKYIYSLF